MIKNIVLILLAGLAVAGCDKKVEITFRNTSPKPLDVSIAGPGKGTGDVGTLACLNGQAKTKIEVSKDLLPASYTWKAGEYSGKITIHNKTDKKLFIRIPGGMVAKPEKVKKKKDSANMGFTAKDNAPENQFKEAYDWDGTFDDAVPEWYSNSLKGLKPGVDFNRKDAD